MNYIICFILGYLVGTVNPSYFFALKKGFDIRKKGSGNAGASNAFITMGKSIGVLCIFLDILKAYGIVELSTYLFSDEPYVFVVTASACMLGHIFPFYMKFRGGKGLACIGGALLAYSPWVFLIALLVEAAIAFSIDYICVVPISASVVLPILYGIIERDIIGMLFLMSVGAIIIWRHKENIIRIKNGTELHLSFIWDKEKELERQKQFIKSDELL
jgi:glycerol-3-phosphate acyltransferase PlsY